MTLMRSLGVVIGTLLLTAWFVSLAVHASVGAVDPITPRYEASGKLPRALPPLTPLVVPARDPFAADVALLPTSAPLAMRSTGSNIASVVVPDPTTFGRGPVAGLGVIGVIVGDGGALALVEDGARVQVVHVHDAFAGSIVNAISPRGISLANGVTLDVDAKPSPSRILPTAVVSPPFVLPTATATPALTGGSASGALGGVVVPQRAPAALATPQSVAPGIAAPSPFTSTGSLFPLLAPPK
jgi:hypothetical protein